MIITLNKNNGYWLMIFSIKCDDLLHDYWNYDELEYYLWSYYIFFIFWTVKIGPQKKDQINIYTVEESIHPRIEP